jgi:hypothetical protein
MIVSKFEFLKAIPWEIERLVSYKNALQFVADNYPNKKRQKRRIFWTKFPFLEN